MQRKTRSQRIIETLLTSGKDCVFNTKVAKRVFAKERKAFDSRRFDSNVMRIARRLRANDLLVGENGQFKLTVKGFKSVR